MLREREETARLRDEAGGWQSCAQEAETDREHWRARAEQTEAVLARVQALCDQAESGEDDTFWRPFIQSFEVRAAIAGEHADREA